MTDQRPLFERIYEEIEQVPRGKVATYGDIAGLVGEGCDARMVGYALNALPDERSQIVPWQRIINSTGGISTRGSRLCWALVTRQPHRTLVPERAKRHGLYSTDRMAISALPPKEIGSV